MHTKKVGHTGTLDPLAQGVLPICIGNATKISQFIVEKEKEYIAELTLGKKTDTYDSTGQVIAENDLIVGKEEFQNSLHLFIGEIDQIPPIYSAIKVNGKKLYEYARENKPVEIKSRKVTITEIELLEFHYPIVKLRVGCTKGTYIRSLCNDLGENLGTFAHMSALIRTKSGPFHSEKAISLDDLSKLSLQQIEETHLFPTDYPLQHLRKVDIEEFSSRFLLNGNPLIQKNIKQNIMDFNVEEKVRLYLKNEFKGLGIMEFKDGYHIKPLRLFIEN